MKHTLRMTAIQHEELYDHLFPGDGKEAVALALCGRRTGDAIHVLTVHKIAVVPYADCPVRDVGQVTWKTDLLEGLLVEATKKGMAILKIHSHPTGYQRFSGIDDIADRDLFRTVNSWLDDDLPNLSAVMLPNGEIFARVVPRNGEFEQVNLVAVVGDELKFWHAIPGSPDSTAFGKKNRQFFGEETYRRLQCLSVAVVGCSGTGSPLIEQLARLGVGKIVLVDPDLVEEKNLNRIINATIDDARQDKPKVQVLAAAIEKMGLGVKTEPLQSNLLDSKTIRLVAECDVVFGCMDSAEGRYYLNKLASFYSLPYFDLGVRLDADGSGSISNASGAVHYVQPGKADLIDRGVVSMDAVAAEGLARRNFDEYARIRKEGYIRNVMVERPAVIMINMQIAAMAVNEFIARLHPYRRLDLKDSAVRTYDFRENYEGSEGEPKSAGLLAAFVGRGDASPFLSDTAQEIQ